ncbi:hypothetical protein J1614_001018 [Plenodomus biglobosus]|nr:hypothetical protein J1614_001018 [Plenodomus biglobosus]
MSDKTKYNSFTKFQDPGSGSRIPPWANVLAALNHIRDLFENKRFLYGVAGGFEILCLGYRREMPDLHIVYDDKDYIRIKKKLEADKRVLTPDGMNPLFPFKILVRTGPAYQDFGCLEVAAIEVNMIPPGSCGSPPSGMLSNNLVLLSLKKDAQLKTYKGLNMLYLLQMMLHLCTARNLAWDPRKDILFLCQKYGNEVQAIRTRLDEKLVQQNFLGTEFLLRLSREDQRTCYEALLGKEPPPMMSITPPTPQHGHGRTVSDSILPTHRLNSDHYMPEISRQKPSELLTLPQSGMAITPQKDSLIITSKPTEQAIAAELNTSEPTASKRYSRSRYRTISPTQVKLSSPEDSLPLQSLQRLSHTHKASVNDISTIKPPSGSLIFGRSLPSQNQNMFQLICPLGDAMSYRQHTAEPERHLSKQDIFEPEGLHGTQPVSGPPSHAMTSFTSSDPVAKAFELDAMTDGHDNLVELSDEIEAAMQLENRALPNTQYSSEELFLGNVKQQHQLEPRTSGMQCAPHNALPASLVAGRGNTETSHSRIMSSDVSGQPGMALTGAVKTNASRYSNYYSPPTCLSSSNAPSHQLTPNTSTVYKAYRPTSLQLSPPTTESASVHRRATSFGNLGNADSARHNFQTHKLDRGHDSMRADVSQNSVRLAQAYQAQIPNYEDGYGTST